MDSNSFVSVIRGTYRPHIDGLRAVAVLAVFLYHINAAWCPYGYLGVDVFFVISGYLITGGILRELSNKSFSFKEFYKRRILRIMPAYFLFIVIVMIVGLIIFPVPRIIGLAETSLSSIFFSTNIYINCTIGGYFSSIANNNPLLNLWSLGVEEQFYIIIPFILYVIARCGIIKERYVLIFIALLSFFLLQRRYATGGSGNGVFYLLHFRMWELLAGALLYSYQDKLNVIFSKKWKYLLSIAGILCIAGSYFTGWGLIDSFRGISAVPVIVGSCLLIICAEGNKIGSLLSLAPSLWVGRISYSLYLWHWPVICYIRYMAGMMFCDEISFSVIEYTEIVLFSFTLAYLSWKYVEMPFRKLKWVSCKKVFIVFCGLIVLLMSAFMMIVQWSNINLKHKDIEWDEHLHTGFVEMFMMRNSVESKELISKNGEKCIPICIFGDSHARALLRGVSKLNDNMEYHLVTYSNNGAPMFDGNKNITQILNKNAQIKNIIIIQRWDLYDMNHVKRLKTFCQIYKNKGYNIFIVTQAPNWEYKFKIGNVTPSEVYNHAKKFNMPQLLALLNMTQEEWETANKEKMLFFKELEAEELADVIDIIPFFTNKGKCVFTNEYMDNKNEEIHPYYLDSNHITSYGAKRPLEFILKTVYEEAEKKKQS